MSPYGDLLTAVQHLAPTWRKTQHANLAQLIAALLARPSLCLSELARARPQPAQPLHGRLKRLSRFLANPRLDELALSVRWLKLSYHFSTPLPDEPATAPLLPILLDTTYFEPYAALIASVPCGSRALPIALTTYHRMELTACFPPRTTWPAVPTARAGTTPSASVVRAWDSQNLIEEQLIDLVWYVSSAALRRILVADRGFARASLFQHLLAAGRDFVIRIDAETHLWLTPEGPSQPVAQALALRVGERRWLAAVWYHSEAKVPIGLLALWEPGYKEPWYLATSLQRADWVELLYRWRMRIETANRDEKTGVLLREGGDAHALRSLLHLHRLLLALCTAHWLCALTGLQALHDLAADMLGDGAAVPAVPLALAPPDSPPTPALLGQGPSMPPPVQPHRGPQPKLAAWEKRFAARGHLSYVRLGCEVLRAPDLGAIVRRLAHWLGVFLWWCAPAWSRRQRQYRQRWWWDTS